MTEQGYTVEGPTYKAVAAEVEGGGITLNLVDESDTIIGSISGNSRKNFILMFQFLDKFTDEVIFATAGQFPDEIDV